MNLGRIISNIDYTIDRYEDLAWLNLYGKYPPEHAIYDMQQLGMKSGVIVKKNKAELPTKLERWFGAPPNEFTVEEFGAVYEIRTTSSHPGLFLDHQMTRQWLFENAKDKSVLNLFSYTGSLTVAAAMGGSSRSVSIDLSNPTTLWAVKNAQINKLGPEHQFAKADVFDWTKRFKKKNLTFDIVISDPPSNSRSDELHFSTTKHMDLLHERCLDCLEVGGTLITSVNTESISEKVLIASVHHVAEKLGRTIKSYNALNLPEGFEPDFRSMKGLKVKFSN